MQSMLFYVFFIFFYIKYTKNISIFNIQTCSQQNKEDILVTITFLISATGHMVLIGIFNYFLLLPVLYSLCTQQTPQLAEGSQPLGPLGLEFRYRCKIKERCQG